MKSKLVVTMAFIFLFASCWAFATTTSVVGSFTDPNDVLIQEINLSVTSNVVLQDFGYSGGTNANGQSFPGTGFFPIMSLFQGTGDSAVFLGNNADDWNTIHTSVAFSMLAAGDYTFALSNWPNYPIAWNYGSGTLGDGFINLAAGFYDPYTYADRDASYAVDITYQGGPVTALEPSALLLLGCGFWGVFGIIRRR